jgi:serine/threonine protein phosphatase PrpC
MGFPKRILSGRYGFIFFSFLLLSKSRSDFRLNSKSSLCAAIDKENQDSFSILPKLSNQSDQALFGVFDGHGKEGHFCSRYARDKVS